MRAILALSAGHDIIFLQLATRRVRLIRLLWRLAERHGEEAVERALEVLERP
jgi:hypothetical protein